MRILRIGSFFESLTEPTEAGLEVGRGMRVGMTRYERYKVEVREYSC